MSELSFFDHSRTLADNFGKLANSSADFAKVSDIFEKNSADLARVSVIFEKICREFEEQSGVFAEKGSPGEGGG